MKVELIIPIKTRASMTAEKQTPHPRFQLNKDQIIPLSICLILLLIYLRTLLPGVGYMGDTAKFQFIGKILGIPHAPGYPNYILLNHFFVTLFPFGSLAFRANFFSALSTILASIFIYKIMRLFKVDPWISGSITLALCLGKTIWIQSVIAEVYSLNLLYIVLVVYLFLKWNLLKKDRYFYLACFFYAISFGNHLIMITLLPGIIYLVWITDKKAFIDPKKIAAILLFIALGAGQYYYLIWRSLDPTSTYLELKATNLSEVLNIITGAGSRDDVFRILTIDQYLTKLQKFAFFFGRELLVLILLPFMGFFSKKRSSLYWFLAILFLGNFVFSFNYFIDDVWVYLIPAYFFLSIFTALGAERLIQFLVKKFGQSKLIYSILFIPLFFLIFNFSRADMSKQNQYQIATEAKLNIIQTHSLIINPEYDEYEYFKYYLLGENVEKTKDIHLVSVEEARSFLAEASNTYQIYTTDADLAHSFTAEGKNVVEVYQDLYYIRN
ncbi:MAG: DUF2723 domain-containing protein [Anaerolineaceae bacterium]